MSSVSLASVSSFFFRQNALRTVIREGCIDMLHTHTFVMPGLKGLGDTLSRSVNGSVLSAMTSSFVLRIRSVNG